MTKKRKLPFGQEQGKRRIESPSFPMAVVIQEASDLAQICEESEVRGRLAAVGVPTARALELRARVAKAQAAESAWIAVRGQVGDPEEQELLARARRIVRDVRAAATFHLRGLAEEVLLPCLERRRGSLAVLGALHECVALLQQRGPLFANDASFDVETTANEASALARALVQAGGKWRRRQALEDAKSARDLAFTELKELTSGVRAAARYAFRDDPATARRFASPYRRRTRGSFIQRRRTQTQTETQTQEWVA